MNDHTWQARWTSVLDSLYLIRDSAHGQQVLDTLTQPKAPTVLGFVNAHALNLVAGSADYAVSLAAADWLLRDGSGMAILLRRLGREPGLNMNGTDLIPRLLGAYTGRRVAFWGTCEPYLSQAVAHCRARYGVEVVSVHDGFADTATYLEMARRLQPELIVLGMGMPKQEAVAAQLAANGAPCLIVCGGAILDFLGGRVSRAPRWLRRLGGEWLYRLFKEPRRLFMRYVVGNPLFLLRALFYPRYRPR
ncbi:WecB/TagA/CpsF family glycosyltransferase [Pseudomonas sp. NY15463]|jgi:exopolysaccharide biosynthesis WecB/TagA/CpsF family protein|uniref:WecB/TagA/CpsF family glycosyltransferase n=1 Tax=Pseudomonas sp. NY15463 TaxID=3400361 RepID=UPI003A8C7257